MKRAAAVILIALGLAGVSVALGFIYMDYVRREGAWVEATAFHHDLSREQRAEILRTWEDPGRGWWAFTTGTIGVACFGAGATLALFELPFFRNRPE